jgi:hypothetical protein
MCTLYNVRRSASCVEESWSTTGGTRPKLNCQANLLQPHTLKLQWRRPAALQLCMQHTAIRQLNNRKRVLFIKQSHSHGIAPISSAQARRKAGPPHQLSMSAALQAGFAKQPRTNCTRQFRHTSKQLASTPTPAAGHAAGPQQNSRHTKQPSTINTCLPSRCCACKHRQLTQQAV